MPDAGAATTTGGVLCASCGTTFEQRGNLWRFLTTARERAAAAFAAQYRAVRERDGYRSAAAGLLPDAAVRASRSPAGRRVADPPRELCPSAGARASGRLARPDADPRSRRRLRLAVAPAGALGYRVVAVDRLDDDADGSARAATTRWRSRRCRPTSTRCRSNRQQFDVVVFNGSLHYSRDPDGDAARGGAHARRRAARWR